MPKHSFKMPSLSDPTPELLNLMNAHPMQVAAIDLLVYYIEAVEENPSRANGLSAALVTLRQSSNAPTLEYGSTLAEVFSFKLAEMHARGLNFDEDNRTFGPTNTSTAFSLVYRSNTSWLRSLINTEVSCMALTPALINRRFPNSSSSEPASSCLPVARL